jgi:uncharacterized membrane protein
MDLRRKGPVFFFGAMALWMGVCVAVFSASAVFAEEKRKNLPARSIGVFPEYTGIVVERGENVSVDLTVANRGRSNENIDLKITSIPKGWKAWIKTYNFAVNSVHVKSDSSKSLTLRAEPDKEVGPGEYTFGVQGKTQDGKLSSKGQVVITVKEKKEEKKEGGVNVITSYPVLRGPTDAKFEFSLEVENKLDKDTIFNLTSQGPDNWEVNFKPAYEDKYISSLRLKANQSQSVAVEVTPYVLAKPGEYPIRVKVSSSEAKGSAALTVALTGTQKLDAGTSTGLLSLTAVRGKPANLSLYVKNSGSGTLSNLRFLSFKAENWKVEVKPERIDSVAPGELKQVEVIITPADQALVGDYSVGLRAEAGKINKTIELRVTVKASTAWGWIGIGIIVLVLAGLVYLFIRLGRR